MVAAVSSCPNTIVLLVRHRASMQKISRATRRWFLIGNVLFIEYRNRASAQLAATRIARNPQQCSKPGNDSECDSGTDQSENATKRLKVLIHLRRLLHKN